ncbi:MAG TPA: YihY/virulence factor BrkB family protein [Caulobacteraceae bacterium]
MMREPQTAPDKPPANGAGVKPKPILDLTLRVAPWLAVAGMALWNRRRKPLEPPQRLSPEAFDVVEPHRGRMANAPWQIPPLGWKDIAWRSYHEYGRTRLPALAGGVTFYLLLATFPAVAAFVSLYGLFSNVDTAEHQFLHLARVFPSDAVNLVGDQMVRIAAQKHGALGAALGVSAAVSIWSANAGMKALFDAVNIAYKQRENRPYVHMTAITYAATVAAMVFIVTTTGVALAVPDALHDLGFHHIAPWWDPLRWLGILAMATLAFTLVYRFGPNRRPPKWRWLVGGGLFAAVAWMAGSLGFTWYLNTFTHLGVTYGSLGAMIGFMLWMWFSVMIVLLGAELNSEIEHQTACDTTIGPTQPMGERGAAVADSVGSAFTASPRQMRDWVGTTIAGAARDVWRWLRGLIIRR